MNGPPARPDLKGDARGIIDLLKAYAQQETIDPLKDIGRYLAYGLAGSVLVAIGLFLLSLAGLRALQTETGTTFTGNWSWAPYFIVLIADVLLALLAYWRIQKGVARKREAGA